MQHHLIRIVSKVLLVIAISASLNAKEIPILKEVTVEVPVKDYSVIKFPFKITNIQTGSFSYIRKKNEKKKLPIDNNGVKKISISKKKGAHNANVATTHNNILNMKKVGTMLTLRPAIKGSTEVIVWGNRDFPILMKIKVVDVADKNIEFVQTIDRKKDVAEFESNPHEVIIERIMRYLYNDNVNPKPRGYETVVRKEIYDVGVKDRSGKTFARVRVSLTKEVVGKRYIGQVWNVNIIPEFDNENKETVEIPNGFSLTLYEEMFDSPGVFAISLETYHITKEHGTRIMVVRGKDSGDKS